MKKLLICGDSFSYDHGHADSWVTQLSLMYRTTNLSQCGCGQYKILRQIRSINPSDFDHIIVFHTSPNRVYLAQPNPLMRTETHVNSDLLFSDVEAKRHTHPLAEVAYNYFLHIYDVDHEIYIHNLLCDEIDRLLPSALTLHCSGFDYQNLNDFQGRLMSFYPVWQQHSGQINHFSATGNQLVLSKIISQIQPV